MYSIHANYVVLIIAKCTDKLIEESMFNIKERAENYILLLYSKVLNLFFFFKVILLQK